MAAGLKGRMHVEGSAVHRLGANTACCFNPFRYNLLSQMRVYGTIELIESDVIHRLGKCTMEFAKSKQNQIHEHSRVITLLRKKKSHLENKKVKKIRDTTLDTLFVFFRLF